MTDPGYDCTAVDENGFLWLFRLGDALFGQRFRSITVRVESWRLDDPNIRHHIGALRCRLAHPQAPLTIEVL